MGVDTSAPIWYNQYRFKEDRLTEERKKKMYYEFYRFEELVEMVAYGEITEVEAETIALELLKNDD